MTWGNFEDSNDDMSPAWMWRNNTPHYAKSPQFNANSSAHHPHMSAAQGLALKEGQRGDPGEFDRIDWDKHAKLAEKNAELAQELFIANKKRLARLLGENSEILQGIVGIATSPKGHLTIKMNTGQEIQFIQHPRTGLVTGARYAKDGMSKVDIQAYVEAIESSGQVANMNKIVPSGSVEFQANAYKQIRELQAERADAVINHFKDQDVALQNALRTKDFASVGMQGKTRAEIREKQSIVNTVSSAIASGRLSEKEVGYLFRMTKSGSKTLAATKNSPNWEHIVALAAKYPAPENDNIINPAQARPGAQQRQNGPGLHNPKVA